MVFMLLFLIFSSKPDTAYCLIGQVRYIIPLSGLLRPEYYDPVDGWLIFNLDQVKITDLFDLSDRKVAKVCVLVREGQGAARHTQGY